ncbi:hypothetical protein PspLS_10326 [Pyricularia sp. CBS 133598]|nr:hypothetical protein PspLS_10326 [Pyricularia sp. CBS 133598]
MLNKPPHHCQDQPRNAQSHVLDTPELLELILALYLLPERADNSKEITSPTSRRRNPLLEEVFAPWFHDPSLGLKESEVFSDPGNDPFREIFGDDNDQCATSKSKRWKKVRGKAKDKDDWIGKEQDHQEKHLRRDRRIEAFLREGASWRRMLVQQPACEKLGFIQQTRGFGGQQSFASAVQEFPMASASSTSPGGVRMGSLYDLVYRFMGHASAAKERVSYCVLWRVHGTDPPLSDWYRSCGGYEVCLHKDFTQDVGVVVMQRTAVPGFKAFEGDWTDEKAVVPDAGMGGQGMLDRWRCAEYERDWKPLLLKRTFEQCWFG